MTDTVQAYKCPINRGTINDSGALFTPCFYSLYYHSTRLCPSAHNKVLRRVKQYFISFKSFKTRISDKNTKHFSALFAKTATDIILASLHEKIHCWSKAHNIFLERTNLSLLHATSYRNLYINVRVGLWGVVLRFVIRVVAIIQISLFPSAWRFYELFHLPIGTSTCLI